MSDHDVDDEMDPGMESMRVDAVQPLIDEVFCYKAEAHEVHWDGESQFIIISGLPRLEIQIKVRDIEEQLKAETGDEYTADDLRERLQGEFVCLPLSSDIPIFMID